MAELKTKKSQLNLILGLATMAVIACVCAAVIATRPKKPAASGPITALTFEEIRQNHERMTKVQWDEYEKSIRGQRVEWRGWVGDVKEDITGTNQVWVDMDAPPDGMNDVFFDYPREKSLALAKGAPIHFRGNFFSGIEILNFYVHLKEAEVLP